MAEQDHDVANGTGDPYGRKGLIPWDCYGPVEPPGTHYVALHLGTRDGLVADLGRDQAFVVHQSDQRADGERAAAESKHVDFIPGPPVAADELVEFTDVGR